MEEIEAFTFTQIETQLGSLASRDAREQLLQWNVDTGYGQFHRSALTTPPLLNRCSTCMYWRLSN